MNQAAKINFTKKWVFSIGHYLLPRWYIIESFWDRGFRDNLFVLPSYSEVVGFDDDRSDFGRLLYHIIKQRVNDLILNLHLLFPKKTYILYISSWSSHLMIRLIIGRMITKGIFSVNLTCWLLQNIDERNFPLINKIFRITMKNLSPEKRSKLRRIFGKRWCTSGFQSDHEGYKVLYDTMEQSFTRLSNYSRSIWLVWKFRIESGISSLSYLSRAPDLRIEVRLWLSGTKNLPFSKKKRNNEECGKISSPKSSKGTGKTSPCLICEHLKALPKFFWTKISLFCAFKRIKCDAVTGSETDPNIQESYELQTTVMPEYHLSQKYVLQKNICK